MGEWGKITVPLVAGFEGCAKKKPDGLIYPYLDTLAKPPRWTRGYGRTYGITADSPPITQTDAIEELRAGLYQYATRIMAMASPLASKNICLAAVTSWSWNCGLGAFKCSRLRKSILKGQWQKAAREMRTPRTAGGKIVSGLARRRDMEASIFLKGI